MISMLERKKMGVVMPMPNQKDLVFLIDLIEDDKVAIIDRCYSLSGVPEALRYLEEGRARGKVVIAVGENGRIQQSAAP
jgi:D-arabinose 1-dehydrogenase-like Zn-dependent alcohol dehydrogenase